MEPLRFGVIGIQGMGGGHIKAIDAVETAVLTAICDVSPDAKAKADELEVAYFDDYRALVRSDAVDAVSICTPHWLHHPMAMEALQNGKHVFIEKPIAISVREADDMVEAAHRNNLKLGVAHQYRTRDANRAAKKAIEEGRVGQILRVLWTSNGIRTMEYYNRDKWRGTWKMEGGGVLINQTIHDLDLLCWLVGEPVEVTALVANRGHETEVEDVACAAIRFENGALASVQLDLLSAPGMSSRVIAGDKGTLTLDGGARLATPKVGALDFIAGNHPPLEGKNDATWEDLTAEAGEGGHAYMIRDFVDAVRSDRPPFVSGEQGRRALEIVNAILYSGLTGESVKLPLDREKYDQLLDDLSQGRRQTPRYR